MKYKHFGPSVLDRVKSAKRSYPITIEMFDKKRKHFHKFVFLTHLDINECSSNPCHGNATCNNTAGSYMCVCDSGYSGDGFNCSGTHNVLSV